MKTHSKLLGGAIALSFLCSGSVVAAWLPLRPLTPPTPQATPAPAPSDAADLAALLESLQGVLQPAPGTLPTLDQTLQSLLSAPAPGLQMPQGPLTAEEVVIGTTARHYLLHTPITELGDEPQGMRPLVLVFHGLRQSAMQMAASNSGQIWRLAADGEIQGINDPSEVACTGSACPPRDEGFYVAFLNGAAAGSLANSTQTTGTWNDCDNNRFNNLSTADDVAFVRALVNQLDDQISAPSGMKRRIDTRRVYAYGFSNGAGMALRLGREAGDVVAAVTAISGVDPNPANDECTEFGRDGISARRPAQILHGTADLLVPYANQCSSNGGLLGATQNCRLSHVATVNAWKTSSGANASVVPPRRVFSKSGTTARPASAAADNTMIECLQHVVVKPSGTFGPLLNIPPDNVRVEACTITGGGHVEPSILTYVGAVTEASFGKQNNDAEAVVQAWQFFDRHRR